MIPPSAITRGDDATRVDLSDLEPERGLEVAALVDQLRALARPGRPVIVRGCPQMLAHTLYKVGELARGWIRLESVREEEPYG